MRRKRKLKRGTIVKAKKHVSIAPAPWNGDHGTGTEAATAGTIVVPIKDSPNRMAQRRKVSVIDTMTGLSMRQVQAAKKLEEAYCRVAMLSSGTALKEQVDASPRPDATIAAQVDAQSILVRCTRPIPRTCRHIVDHVCQYNLPLATLARAGTVRPRARFAAAMDLIADALGY